MTERFLFNLFTSEKAQREYDEMKVMEVTKLNRKVGEVEREVLLVPSCLVS